MIENKHLCAIFLLLHSELRDEDIPKRTALRKCIIDVFTEYLDNLEREIKVFIIIYSANLLLTYYRILLARSPS